MASVGPLSGTECRLCRAVCMGSCVADVGMSLDAEWSWTKWEGGRLELCDASEGMWERGWERIFVGVVRERAARVRRGRGGWGWRNA